MAAAHRFGRVLGPRLATSRLRDEEAHPALERADKVVLRSGRAHRPGFETDCRTSKAPPIN